MEKNYTNRLVTMAVLLCMALSLAGQRKMESLDRGVVAVKVTNGVFLSWRLLGDESMDMQFNVYRNGQLLSGSPFSGATNLVDASGTTLSSYTVEAVLEGQIQNISQPVTPWASQYKTLQLNRPAAGVTPPNASGNVGKAGTSYPDGQNYTYTPNDCMVGDVDGDGQYELIVKWDPSNSHDNSQYGITGNVYVDAYELNGTQLWRIDLGRNIRAGAHYTQIMVADYDGDGKAEVVMKTAPGTVDGQGKNVLMGSDAPNADYRNLDPTKISGSTMVGTVLTGPEYLTLFDGTTGAGLHSVAFAPVRSSISSWGDSYGNRSERYLACVAYLDGVNPSVVMGRGYYAKTCLSAFDVVNKQLVKRWDYVASSSGTGAYGQGNHNLSVADVDADGKDEIIYGACAINDNGAFMYRTGLGHGDAMHLSDLNPDRPGLEVFCVHEETSAAYGYEMHDAATGEVLWGVKTGTDVGRGVSADIDGAHRGFEAWVNDVLYSCTGEVIANAKPGSVNFRVYWDGDLQDELLDGVAIGKWNSISKTSSTLINFGNLVSSASCNSTKKTPCLSADILGDWREEVILYNANDPSKINIFTTVIPTDHRLFTLMHDPVYRLAVAWQNVAYNQPPHLGFYIGDGVDDLVAPNIETIPLAVNNRQQGGVEVYGMRGQRIGIKADAEILEVVVHGITGQLLAGQGAVSGDETELTVPLGHRLCLVKVTTRTGTQVRKVVLP
ncbi:rhamnogalacturonan lyase [Breznakibacter xylanolyticus]|nr:rhamnogalacturonan lyase [Breznakibacter xylanolyticus]